jgi:rhodanese-related sulfurtransferase
LVVGLAIALLVASPLACGLASSPAISNDALASQIASGTAPVVLDVRSTSEYDGGHVPGAIHLPFQSVSSHHEELGLDKAQPIVVYCAHGPRAALAGRALRKAGYSNVLYLEGHMSAWKDAGLPTEKTPGH